jgi:hypothetical protein
LIEWKEEGNVTSHARERKSLAEAMRDRRADWMKVHRHNVVEGDESERQDRPLRTLIGMVVRNKQYKGKPQGMSTFNRDILSTDIFHKEKEI